jgi:hypothetical protein
MIAQLNFHGPPEAWQAYCEQVVELYSRRAYGGRTLQSIYLQKLDYEFESNLGLISTSLNASGKRESSYNVQAPPGYLEQLKQ